MSESAQQIHAARIAHARLVMRDPEDEDGDDGELGTVDGHGKEPRAFRRFKEPWIVQLEKDYAGVLI